MSRDNVTFNRLSMILDDYNADVDFYAAGRKGGFTRDVPTIPEVLVDRLPKHLWPKHQFPIGSGKFGEDAIACVKKADQEHGRHGIPIYDTTKRLADAARNNREYQARLDKQNGCCGGYVAL